MGKCIYCGRPAGFLRRYHKECKEKHDRGVEEIKEKVKDFFENGGEGEKLYDDVKSIAKNSYIKEEELKKILIEGWRNSVELAFDDGVLTEEEEKRLKEMVKFLHIDTPEVLNSNAYSYLEKGAVLRSLLEGKLPENLPSKAGLPFNFLKSETLLWVFDNVEYYEKVTRKSYAGGYSGFSIRIARGLYWRVGGFKGNPVVKTELQKIDEGIMAVTTKHIYFAGSRKIFRIRLDRIVAFEPYSDGIGIQRDAKTANPQYFITGDGWFTYNLVRNATNVV